MKNLEAESAVAEAMSFLTSRVAEQSRTDLVPLSDIELRQLAFSEETATAEALADAAEFDAANNSKKFEAKITKLLRRAYRYDVQHGMEAIWREHLSALCDHDVYVLVMVDQAKIPRPKPNLLVAFIATLTRRGLVRLLPDLVAWFVAISGFVYFFVLPGNTYRTSGVRIFGDLAERLIPNENVRLGVFVTWLGVIYWESRRLRKRQPR